MADISSMFSSGLTNFSVTTMINSLLSVQKLVTACAYIMGISFAVKAIYSIKALAQERSQMSTHGSLKEPVFYFLAAAMLIYLPTSFRVFLNSIFGEGSQILAYAPVSDNSPLSTLFDENSVFSAVIALVIQIIGVIAFIRGWVLIARSASQGQPPGGTGKGLAHVFGGILAMNIVGTLQVVNNTLFGS